MNSLAAAAPYLLTVSRLLLAGVFLIAAACAPTAQTKVPVAASSTASPSQTPTEPPEPTPFATPTPPSLLFPADSYSPAVSSNCNRVAFVSRTDATVTEAGKRCYSPTGEGLPCSNIILYDRQNGGLQLVSIGADGQPGNGNSYAPAISADGNVIAFVSEATNLATARTISQPGILAYDLRDRSLQWISVAGTQPSLSGDGNLVAYIKDGAVQVRNRQTGQTEQITKGINGDAPDGDSQAPQISADGRWVAFWSWAGNLASDDTKVCRENETLNYSCGDVFLFDRETGELSRIDVGEPYGLGMGSYHLSISGDGQYVAFFDKVYNRANGQIEPLCGTREQSCSAGVLSEDGRRVAYASGADFFVFDRTTGKRELVSVSSDGTPGNGEPIDFMISSEGESFQPGFDISGDGHLVVFASTASNLAPSDKAICSNSLFAPHNCLDIFMHDLSTGKTARISKSGQ